MTTIDLTTGIARPPSRSDYLTQKAGCKVAPPGTPHPIWTAFLIRITNGNAEQIAFLQRYIGYCLTGDVSEHVFVFAYGTGANGKSTFIATIQKIFGDYATVADMATFLASNNDRHPTELAKLHGARLVVATETQAGRAWTRPRSRPLPAAKSRRRVLCVRIFSISNPLLNCSSVGTTSPVCGMLTKPCVVACCSCRSPFRSRRPSAIPS